MNKLKAQVTQIAGGILTAGYFVLYKKPGQLFGSTRYASIHTCLLFPS